MPARSSAAPRPAGRRLRGRSGATSDCAAHVRGAPRSPSVYVYELWDHTSLILQYRAYGAYCVHRYFDPSNVTTFNDHNAKQVIAGWLARRCAFKGRRECAAVSIVVHRSRTGSLSP